MKLAAHQPSFLPAISYFYKFLIADVIVLADDYQYTTHNQINRCRIKSVNGPEWLTIPVLTKGRHGQLINQVDINPHKRWAEKHMRSLSINYRYAAYFEQYIDAIENIYLSSFAKLAKLNMALLSFLFDAMAINCKLVLSSTLSLQAPGHGKLLQMLEKTDCSIYLAEPELRNFLTAEAFEAQGYELVFTESAVPEYHQQFEGFVSNLSIIDLVLNEGSASRELLLKGSAIDGRPQ